MSFIINPYIYTSAPLYDGVTVSYTLRRPDMTNLWTNAVLKLRRSSDNATAFVFFDGSDANDTITTSSLISTSSDTTPGATTLGTWVGANDAFVETWYGITDDNTIDTNKKANQTTTSAQPQFISSGSLITKNGKIELDFIDDARFLQTPSSISALTYSLDYTVFTVSHHDTSASQGCILSTSLSTTDYMGIFNDRRTQKRIGILLSGGTFVFANYLAQQDTSNQKLLTIIHNGVNLVSYYNGTIQETTAHSSLAYLNTAFLIGRWASNTTTGIENGIQEIVIFPTANTTKLSDRHSDINSYYSIY